MTPSVETALEPLRTLVLRRARADADAILAEADADAARVIGTARAEADRILAAARSSGAADAEALRVTEVARACRSARGLVLLAQRDVYDDVRRRTRAALTADDTAARVRAALEARARSVLGPDARIVDVPVGGVTGEIGGLRVDCSVDALVERAITVEAGRLAGAWST
jgi:cell division septum initiation protein DivIVA